MLSSLHWFCSATFNPSSTWFWGSNQEIVTVILRPKSPNQSCQFWGPNWETRSHRFWGKTRRTRHHRFWGQTRSNRPRGFEAKPMTNHPNGFKAKPLTNRRPWFWGSTKKHTLLVFMCTVQTTHGVTRPLDHPATEYLTSATIPDPLH
jgi:hypothetical protein